MSVIERGMSAFSEYFGISQCAKCAVVCDCQGWNLTVIRDKLSLAISMKNN